MKWRARRPAALGYNSLRFDDEFVRYGLYRNFHDAYEREWRGGNSRWDLLDALRLMHALRPDGIAWRQREDGGGTSFKLEHLAEDNGLRIGDAHEALSRRARDDRPRPPVQAVAAAPVGLRAAPARQALRRVHCSTWSR